jgi:phage shock protein C
MYCTKCGTQLVDSAKFCSDCGSPTTNYTHFAQDYPRLSRPRLDRKIAGVCAGFARYLGVDVTLVRLIAIVLAICPGVGVIAYIVAWIVMPNDPLPMPGTATNAQPAM